MRRGNRGSEILVRAARVRLLILDVDGVLTDGRIYLGPSGEEMKVFHVRDGSAIVRALNAGIKVALVSGRKSAAVRRRARELGVREVYQGVKDQTAVFQVLLRRHGLSPREVACVGDDASDRDLLRAAGFAATPADGHPSLDAVTQYRSKTKGGEGAVMEIIDLILKSRRARG